MEIAHRKICKHFAIVEFGRVWALEYRSGEIVKPVRSVADTNEHQAEFALQPGICRFAMESSFIACESFGKIAEIIERVVLSFWEDGGVMAGGLGVGERVESFA